MMIPREYVGKTFPQFKVTAFKAIFDSLFELTQSHLDGEISSRQPPCNWPAIMLSRGTACLMNVWEELGIDPLRAFLSSEEFVHFHPPGEDEELTGSVRMDDIREILDEEGGVCDQADFTADFFNAAGLHLAAYRFSYRVRLTATARCIGYVVSTID